MMDDDTVDLKPDIVKLEADLVLSDHVKADPSEDDHCLNAPNKFFSTDQNQDDFLYEQNCIIKEEPDFMEINNEMITEGMSQNFTDFSAGSNEDWALESPTGEVNRNIKSEVGDCDIKTEDSTPSCSSSCASITEVDADAKSSLVFQPNSAIITSNMAQIEQLKNEYSLDSAERSLTSIQNSVSSTEKFTVSPIDSARFWYIDNPATVNDEVKAESDLIFANNINNQEVSTQSHFLAYSDEKQFSCDQCSYRCKRKEQLRLHLCTHSGKKPFSCNQCSYQCTQIGNLQRHSLTHLDNKCFSCHQCSYRCKRKDLLDRHLHTHSGEKPFSCDQCSYRGKHKYLLKAHMVTHSGSMRFSCNQCSFQCKHKGSLQAHLLTHSDTKPFSCDQCSSHFKSKRDLNRHLIVHSEDKPFSCDQCSYKCRQKWDLPKHLLTHYSLKPFSCDQCSFTCILKGDLKRHLLTHSGQKPFSCDQCSYRSVRKYDLNVHLRTHVSKKPFSSIEGS